jgi:hypothetical protein
MAAVLHICTSAGLVIFARDPIYSIIADFEEVTLNFPVKSDIHPQFAPGKALYT